MDAKIKAQWVEALRSGEYTQGIGRLESHDGKFCCWGVLCDLAVKAGVVERFPGERITYGRGYFRGELLPPDTVADWAGIDVDAQAVIGGELEALHRHNDTRASFAQIADAIEAQL